MAGKVNVKTFAGGMNKDIDFSLLKDNQYFDALNYKLVANEDANGFTLENAEGNSFWVNIEGIVKDEYKIIGHCFIHPYLVLFATDNENTKAPNGGISVIIRITVDKDEYQDISVIYRDDTVEGTLNFSDTYPISAVGYYEGSDNIKVYWTDNYNPIRGVNIMDSNLDTYSTGMLDLIPDFPLDTASPIDPRPNTLGLTTGALDACSVQYTYQYYIENGGQTSWAPMSPLQVVPTKEGFNFLRDQEGGEVDEETGYGVKFNIDIPSTNLYSNIRVIAVQYNSLNGVPTVRVIKELEIPSSTETTISVIDRGNVITVLLYEDIAISNSVSYKAKTLEIKDNRLFLGNITEDFFDVDFDARAYRHAAIGGDPKADARIYESDLTTYSTVNDSGTGDYTFAQVPETHDCINRFNDPDQEDTLIYQFQSDGATWGAEGSNVKVSFDVSSEVVLDTSLTSSTRPTNITVSGTGSTLYDAGKKSFHRQEVYRIGIVFKNTKLQTSPVKWVCDLKMPTYSDDSDAFVHLSYTPGSDLSSVLLGVEVEITSSLPAGAVGWEIVYVPRESDDRGVLGQGIIQPAVGSGSNHRATPSMLGELVIAPITWDDVTWFESPEISFNKNLKYKTGDFYNKIGYYTRGSGAASTDLDDTANYSYNHHKVVDFSPQGDYTADYKNVLDDAKVIGYDTDGNTRITLDNETVVPYIADGVNSGPNTTVLVAEHGTFDTDFINPGGGSAAEVPVANYRRNVFEIQFGGLSYYERQRNVYILASDIKLSNGSIITWEGDTVIDFFHYTKRCIDIPIAISGSATAGSTHLFAVETSILTRMSNSPYLYKALDSERHRLVQEISGTWEGEIEVSTGTYYTYDQEYELYRYNSVYSQQPMAIQFIADNEVFDEQITYETRVLSSEKKINNETLDSFTQFKINNFIDLNGDKGPLNNLMLFKDQLFFWQNTAFGVASVNTRSLIQDNNSGILALGTGGVLDRYDYLSDSIGNQSQFGIAKSRVALYWGDTNKNELFKYSDGLKSESKLKGIQTWINANGRMGEIKTVFDHKYNDVIFTITFARKLATTDIDGEYVDGFSIIPTTGLSTSSDYNIILNANYPSTETYPSRNVLSHNGSDWQASARPYGTGGTEYYVTIDHDPTQTYTITFNEIANGWVSRNSFTPGRYMELDTNYLSTNDYLALYKHNDTSASRCTYYGTEYDSELTLIFNKEYPYTKVWDSLKWHSESEDSDGVNQFKDTFDTLTIYNDYQHTGDRDLYYKGGIFGTASDAVPSTRPTELTRRERTWSMVIPRDIVNVDVSSNPDITSSGNWDETQSFKERMRSKWIACTFTYNNASNNTFSIPFISSIYRQSKR